jgi:hypothetical protein
MPVAGVTVATGPDLAGGTGHGRRVVRGWRLATRRSLCSVYPGPGGKALPWHAAKRPGRSVGYVLDQVAVSYMPNIRSLRTARAVWERQ